MGMERTGETLKGRSRLMSFRLSHEQYEAVRSACEQSEVRSVSEFTRLAVLHAIKRQRYDTPIWADDLATLGQGLRELDERLAEMRQAVRRLLGGTTTKE
jgi:hypothetical protein